VARQRNSSLLVSARAPTSEKGEDAPGGPCLYAVPDFVLLTGLVTWIDDQAELDRRLPPPSRMRRGIARWLRLGL